MAPIELHKCGFWRWLLGWIHTWVPTTVSAGEEKLQLRTEQEVKVTNEAPAAGLPVASSTGDAEQDVTPPDSLRTPQAPPPCAVGVSNSVPALPSVSHDAPGALRRPKTVPNILSRSKTPFRPSPLDKLKGKTVCSSTPSWPVPDSEELLLRSAAGALRVQLSAFTAAL